MSALEAAWITERLRSPLAAAELVELLDRLDEIHRADRAVAYTAARDRYATGRAALQRAQARLTRATPDNRPARARAVTEAALALARLRQAISDLGGSIRYIISLEGDLAIVTNTRGSRVWSAECVGHPDAAITAARMFCALHNMQIGGEL